MNIKNSLLTLIFLLAPLGSIAGHLKLHTSSVIIEADIGENAFPVKNESLAPLMMLTSLENLPEDPERLVTVTPPVARIEPNDTQIVRFLLKESATNLKTEHMARVTFEGIPPKGKGDSNRISINIAQNIPVIIRPKGLKRNYEPWKGLDCYINTKTNNLIVENPSPYIVRFHPNITMLPAQGALNLPGSYLLPGKTMIVALPKQVSLNNIEKIKITPASLYSYMLDPVELPVKVS